MNDIIEISIRCGRFSYSAKINPGDASMAQEAKEYATFILDRAAGELRPATGQDRKARRTKPDTVVTSTADAATEEESL